ncbi:hypothetical protein [Halorubrum sp. CSM-61]|uniref:hypothetical protein n=1 Tax=Halorubrum sp. CSM-61 TaxID=2485838 RepID=UPI000F4C2B23|nr:hypothetical protein [Halorubrum sp. CSM-61]
MAVFAAPIAVLEPGEPTDGRERVRHLSPERVIEDDHEVYERALSRPPTGIAYAVRKQARPGTTPDARSGYA